MEKRIFWICQFLTNYRMALTKLPLGGRHWKGVEACSTLLNRHFYRLDLTTQIRMSKRSEVIGKRDELRGEYQALHNKPNHFIPYISHHPHLISLKTYTPLPIVILISKIRLTALWKQWGLRLSSLKGPFHLFGTRLRARLNDDCLDAPVMRQHYPSP